MICEAYNFKRRAMCAQNALTIVTFTGTINLGEPYKAAKLQWRLCNGHTLNVAKHLGSHNPQAWNPIVNIKRIEP